MFKRVFPAFSLPGSVWVATSLMAGSILAQPVLAESSAPGLMEAQTVPESSFEFSSEFSQETPPTLAQATFVLSPRKEALVREYLDITQASAAAAQMMEPMLPLLQEAYPSVPPEFFETFMDEVADGSLAEFLVPVFAKHLTEVELDAAIAFYKTPEGASMLAKMPGLMQDSQQAGALWGEQLGEQIIRALESKGYVSDVSEI